MKAALLNCLRRAVFAAGFMFITMLPLYAQFYMTKSNEVYIESNVTVVKRVKLTNEYFVYETNTEKVSVQQANGKVVQRIKTNVEKVKKGDVYRAKVTNTLDLQKTNVHRDISFSNYLGSMIISPYLTFSSVGSGLSPKPAMYMSVGALIRPLPFFEGDLSYFYDIGGTIDTANGKQDSINLLFQAEAKLVWHRQSRHEMKLGVGLGYSSHADSLLFTMSFSPLCFFNREERDYMLNFLSIRWHTAFDGSTDYSKDKAFLKQLSIDIIKAGMPFGRRYISNANGESPAK